MEERWVPVLFNDNYEASNTGFIRNKHTGRILKTWINDKGYETVCLSDSGIRRMRKVHKLVAEAFYDGPLEDLEGLEAYHRDGNKLNNCIDNLVWGTRSDVIKNTYRTGKLSSHRKRRIRVIETGEVFDSIEECSRAIGINPATISKCLNYDFYRNRKGLHFEEVD